MKKIISVIFIMFFAMDCGLSTTYAAVPRLLDYQGRLTDSAGKPLEGTYNLTFRIFDQETAGNLLWEETHSGVVIQKGVFGVLLGSITNFDLAFDKPYFLEIKVNDEVMSPRLRIASSGYAIRSASADQAEVAKDALSLTRGVIVMWSGSIASIPAGWALCDGTNGTPDLRDMFVVGARQDENGVAKTNVMPGLTQSGGSSFITTQNLPAHVHGPGTLSADSSGAHTHDLKYGGAWSGFTVPDGKAAGDLNYTFSSGVIATSGTHTHTITTGTTAMSGESQAYAPRYYALAYIMKL